MPKIEAVKYEVSDASRGIHEEIEHMVEFQLGVVGPRELLECALLCVEERVSDDGLPGDVLEPFRQLVVAGVKLLDAMEELKRMKRRG